MNIFSGLTVFGNPIVPEFSQAPSREHKEKAWMGERYKSRIQKKWNKRFGFNKTRAFNVELMRNAILMKQQSDNMRSTVDSKIIAMMKGSL